MLWLLATDQPLSPACLMSTQFLSANRLSLGGALDGIIAAKRMDMSKKGVETCGDIDEGCAVEW